MLSTDQLVVVKKAMEKTYIGRCTVIAYEKGKNPKTKVTEQTEAIKLKYKKCRISYKTIDTVNDGEFTARQTQVIKLFLDPQYRINPGSKFIISQEGETIAYKNSGKAARYATHQEIILELFKEWA